MLHDANCETGASTATDAVVNNEALAIVSGLDLLSNAVNDRLNQISAKDETSPSVVASRFLLSIEEAKGVKETSEQIISCFL